MFTGGVKKCQLAPDLSWGMKIECCQTELQRNDIYMSFRSFCEGGMDDNGIYRQELKEVIKHIVRNIRIKVDANIVFFFQCDEDYVFMKEIYDDLSEVKNLIMMNELLTLDNAYRYYGKAKCVFQ